MVFAGRLVSANDIFAKFVDSGNKVISVDEMLADLEEFAQKLNSWKIGSVVLLEASENAARGFAVRKADFDWYEHLEKKMP